MNRNALILLAYVSVTLFWGGSSVVAQPNPKYTDPQDTDVDFPLQGEYAAAESPEKGPALQVIALGKGEFEAVVYKAGLPGNSAKKEKPTRIRAKRAGDLVRFVDGENKYEVDGKVGAFEVGNDKIAAKKVSRQSPSLGLKPPKNGIVLFDGTSADGWEGGKLDGELLAQGTRSKEKFASHRLHIEFRVPYQPLDRGQGRGNSGIYVQGRYEIQMLDSFGLAGLDNECGGLYSVKEPSLNMCYPPLAWQTYDIDYTAAKFDDAGKLTKNPRVTVRHNGVMIHDDVELPGERSTTAAPVKPGTDLGPVYLQNHGCPVRYRNIWAVKTSE
jgi:hypothetical protein